LGFPKDLDGFNEARQVLDQLAKTEREACWGAFWALDQECLTVVGLCGYKGPPKGGEIEIAYFTFPVFEGRGEATRMVSELCKRARSAVGAVVAHTLPMRNASNGALQRCGFEFDGVVVDPEDGDVWRWMKVVGDAPRG